MSGPTPFATLRMAEDGTVRVTGVLRPGLLAELRARRAELLEVLAAFPGATVEIRPASPIPDEPQLGDWVWSRPLPPRRPKGPRRRGTGAAAPDGPDPEPRAPDWGGPGPDPMACLACGEPCDPRDLAGCARAPSGRWEHLSCWLRREARR